MKLQEITFNRPIKIIQVYRNMIAYDKSMKSFDTRRELLSWNNINSKTGYVSNEELLLPFSILENPDFKNCDIIIIEDNNLPHHVSTSDLMYRKVISTGYDRPSNYCFRSFQANNYHSFELKKSNNIEVHLKYGYFEIGLPKRDNFKICELKQNSPVEIRINGKTDHSLTSRRARIFKDQVYIFNYLGDFDKCKILKEPYSPVLKEVPSERKLVDLNKQLW